MSNPFRKLDGNTLAKSQHAHRQFSQQYAAGRGRVLDRFNQPLDVGTIVVYRPAQDLVFTVVEATPILDPQAPPGAVRVVLQAIVPMLSMGGQPRGDMIVIGRQDVSGDHVDISGPKAQDAPVPLDMEGDASQDAMLGPGDVDPRD